VAENPSYRDACRRQHRAMGNYLAIDAWSRGLDCLVPTRKNLETLFGLTKLTKTRVEWIREDIRPWFLYSVEYGWGQPYTSSWSTAALFLSRLPIADHLPRGRMSAEARIKGMAIGAPRTAFFRRGNSRIPREGAMVSRLARYAAGLDVPRSRRSRS
jgi:hypothetical protein